MSDRLQLYATLNTDTHVLDVCAPKEVEFEINPQQFYNGGLRNIRKLTVPRQGYLTFGEQMLSVNASGQVKYTDKIVGKLTGRTVSVETISEESWTMGTYTKWLGVLWNNGSLKQVAYREDTNELKFSNGEVYSIPTFDVHVFADTCMFFIDTVGKHVYQYNGSDVIEIPIADTYTSTYGGFGDLTLNTEKWFSKYNVYTATDTHLFAANIDSNFKYDMPVKHWVAKTTPLVAKGFVIEAGQVVHCYPIGDYAPRVGNEIPCTLNGILSTATKIISPIVAAPYYVEEPNLAFQWLEKEGNACVWGEVTIYDNIETTKGAVNRVMAYSKPSDSLICELIGATSSEGRNIICNRVQSTSVGTRIFINNPSFLGKQVGLSYLEKIIPLGRWKVHLLGWNISYISYDSKALCGADEILDNYFYYNDDTCLYKVAEGYRLVTLGDIQDGVDIQKVCNGVYNFLVTDADSLFVESEMRLEPFGMLPGMLVCDYNGMEHALSYSVLTNQSLRYVVSLANYAIDGTRYTYSTGVKTQGCINFPISNDGFTDGWQTDFTYAASVYSREPAFHIEGGEGDVYMYNSSLSDVSVISYPFYAFSNRAGQLIDRYTGSDCTYLQQPLLALPAYTEFVNTGTVYSSANIGIKSALLPVVFNLTSVFYTGATAVVPGKNLQVFSLFSQFYAYDGECIYAINFTNYNIDVITPAAYITHAKFLGASNIKAYFYSEYDKSIYTFSGARDLLLEKEWSSKPQPEEAYWDGFSEALIWRGYDSVTDTTYVWCIKLGVITECLIPGHSDGLVPSRHGLYNAMPSEFVRFSILDGVPQPFELKTKPVGGLHNVRLDTIRLDIRVKCKLGDVIEVGTSSHSTVTTELQFQRYIVDKIDSMGYALIKHTPAWKEGYALTVHIKSKNDILLTDVVITQKASGELEGALR